MKFPGIIFSIIFIAAGFSCNSSFLSKQMEFDESIDSLIIVRSLNDNTRLIKFGYDAITAIKTNEGIIVIDAGISTVITERYKYIIEKEFKSTDIRYLINTHGHPDHTGGNGVFSDAKLITQFNAAQEITNYRKSSDKNIEKLQKIILQYETSLNTSDRGSKEWGDNFTQKIRYETALLDIHKQHTERTPDITFTDTLLLKMDNITIEMKYFGSCHSQSDILICIPEMNILFSGDLISQYGRPYIDKALALDFERWNESVLWIKERLENIDLIIDGHGQIFNNEILRSFNNNIISEIPPL